jgi:hypothetical protein
MFKKHFNLAVIFLLIVLISGVYTAVAQEINSKTESSEKVLTAEPLSPNSPVRIEEVKVGDIVTSFSNQPVIITQTDWLKNLTFKVKNLTQKKIIYISFNISFFETATNGQYPMGIQPKYGQSEGFTREGRAITMNQIVNGKVLPIEIKPGKDFEFSLKDRYDGLVRFIETRQPISTINKVHVSFSVVGFDDGTFWSYGGTYFKYDQDNPGQQIKLPVPELISLPTKFL